jgi:peptidoglycan/xylan/chitin deacetylase (PgdA/CDA1 family)
LAGVVRGRTWLLRNSLSGGPAEVTSDFGLTGDRKVMGDWNGDGTRTPGVFRNGTWYLRDRNGSGGRLISFPFGAAGDHPVVGDWNGDGIDTIGIFRAGAWHLRNTISGGSPDRLFYYGRQPGDVPVVWKQVRTTVPAGLQGGEWTRLPTTQKVVALTFDAGANADGVPSIMGTLRSTGVAATFFLTGQWVERFPEQTRQIGTYYPIGNHTYSHPSLPALTDAQVREQITLAHERIRSATAQDARPLFRFPFGDRDARTIGLANSLSYGSIRWTVDTLGWQGTSGGQTVEGVVNRVLATLQPGQIVLMHLGSHPTDHSTLDADALPVLISELRQRGYTFTTVRQHA